MECSFSLLQSEWWARVKATSGWRSQWHAYSGVRGEGRVLSLARRVGPFRLAYLPHAFGEERGRCDLARVAHQLSTFSWEEPLPHVIRWDVPWERGTFDEQEARNHALRGTPSRVQPPDTVVVDVRPSEELLLAGMKSKTRYNVRLAIRKGVEVVAHNDEKALEQMPHWYALYRETARRDRIAIHPEEYYHRVVEQSLLMRRSSGEGSAPRLTLYSAYHERELLAGIIVASWRGMSTYLYGAGSNHKRNLMPAYLLQWTAMRGARDGGDWYYDLFGVPPTDDPSHSMHGLYRFKTGFGGEVIHRPGCWDLSRAPGMAALFRGGERIRQWYYLRYKKR